MSSTGQDNCRQPALTGVPIAEAINTCTNLRRRFGLFGPEGDRAWAAFLDGVRACENSRDVLGLALAARAAAPKLKPSPFGCFSYDARAADGILRLHFMPEPRHRDSSPLADNSMHERRAVLGALFADVRERHPEVRHVRGLSWLYNIQPYKRLFPPAFTESLAPVNGLLHLNGSSTWGQVLNYRHELRPGVADRVLTGLEPKTVRTPWQAFPLQPLVAICSVNCFFEWFAIR